MLGWLVSLIGWFVAWDRDTGNGMLVCCFLWRGVMYKTSQLVYTAGWRYLLDARADEARGQIMW